MHTGDYHAARSYLLDIDRPEAEVVNHRFWVDGNLPRFLRTLDIVPEGGSGQRCLEIGSMPYTFTLLMKQFRPYQMSCVDYFSGAGERQHSEVVRLSSRGETHELTSELCDVEREALPFPSESFEGVLCCEVLEHLTTDPIRMLAEINRVLKPNGWFVLTTPNVANLENILSLIHGRNVYRPYELVFGPTWRHNREYTVAEVNDLLTGCGMKVDRVFAEDTLPPGHRRPFSQRALQRLLEARYRHSLGPQLFARAHRGDQFRWYYPSWLFDQMHSAPRLPFIRIGENDAVQLDKAWLPAEGIGPHLVRGVAGNTACAYLARPDGACHLRLDLHQSSGEPAVFELEVSPYPPDSSTVVSRTIELSYSGWHTISLTPGAQWTCGAVQIRFRREPASKASLPRLREIRWDT